MKVRSGRLYPIFRSYPTVRWSWMKLLTDWLTLSCFKTVSHCELITDEGILWLYPIQTVSHSELITDGGIHWQTLSCFQTFLQHKGIHWLIWSCFQTLSGYGLIAWRYSLTDLILFSDLIWLWAYSMKVFTDWFYPVLRPYLAVGL